MMKQSEMHILTNAFAYAKIGNEENTIPVRLKILGGY